VKQEGVILIGSRVDCVTRLWDVLLGEELLLPLFDELAEGLHGRVENCHHMVSRSARMPGVLSGLLAVREQYEAVARQAGAETWA
jgi:hypothetical protein